MCLDEWDTTLVSSWGVFFKEFIVLIGTIVIRLLTCNNPTIVVFKRVIVTKLRTHSLVLVF